MSKLMSKILQESIKNYEDKNFQVNLVTKIYRVCNKIFKLNRIRDYSSEKKLDDKQNRWLETFKKTEVKNPVL
jgi:hypothetical protein